MQTSSIRQMVGHARLCRSTHLVSGEFRVTRAVFGPLATSWIQPGIPFDLLYRMCICISNTTSYNLNIQSCLAQNVQSSAQLARMDLDSTLSYISRELWQATSHFTSWAHCHKASITYGMIWVIDARMLTTCTLNFRRHRLPKNFEPRICPLNP